MTRRPNSLGAAALVGFLAAAVLSAVGPAAARPVVAAMPAAAGYPQFGCSAMFLDETADQSVETQRLTVVDRGGVNVNQQSYTKNTLGHSVSVISNLRYVQSADAGTSTSRNESFTGFVDSSGTLLSTSYTRNADGTTFTIDSPLQVSPRTGWAGFTTLIYSETTDDQWLYGRNANGYLYRYHGVYDEEGGVITMVGAGKVRGVGNVKGLALIAQHPTYDVLLANLTNGSLVAISVSKTSTFTTHTTTIRSSSWATFDRLVVGGCGSESAVVGVVLATKRAYLYQVGHLAGTATTIVGHGTTTTSVPGDRIAQVGISVQPAPLDGG